MCKTIDKAVAFVRTYNSKTAINVLWIVLTCMSFAATASNTSAEVIAEGFDLSEKREHGGLAPVNYRVLCQQTDSGLQQTIRRAAASHFAWGAYCRPGSVSVPDDKQPHRWISLANRVSTTSLVFDPGCFAEGNYAYTRFDSDDTDGNNHVPDRQIDLRSDKSYVAISVYVNKSTCPIAIMLRCGDQWWCSESVLLDEYPFGNGYNVDRRYKYVPSQLMWYRLSETEGMERVDGSAGPLELGEAGSPDLSRVNGMGLMCRGGEPGDPANELYVSGMALSDHRTPRADLNIGIKNSDVAFLHRASPIEKFEECGGAKIIYWGSGWSPERKTTADEAGVRYMPVVSMGSCRYSMLNAYPKTNPDLPGAVAVDWWGRIVTAQNATYLNNRICRMCIRNPASRQNMKDYLRDRVYKIGAREALIDEPAGANGNSMLLHVGGGCFCDLCTDGFRKYLRDEGWTDAMLRQAGIPETFADIDQFDYRAFVQSLFPKGTWPNGEPNRSLWQRAFTNSTRGDWQGENKVKNDLPLIRQFIRFQQLPAREAYRELRAYAESLDPDFKVSANAYNLRPQSLYTVEENTAGFVGAECEVFVHQVHSMPKHFIRLRLADALGTRVMTPGVHWEWEMARNKGITVGIKITIAAHYASGHQFSPPDFYDWVDPHYYGNMSDYGPYYRFVREHPDLFDDYQTLTQIGVLHNSSTLVSGDTTSGIAFAGDKTFLNDYYDIALKLFGNDYPVGVACAGDGVFLKQEFSEEDLRNRFEYLVEPRNLHLEGRQATAIEALRAEGKVYTWTANGYEDVKNIRKQVEPWIQCNANRVWVMPRTRNPQANETDSDLIIHLVNGNIQNDELKIANDFWLDVRKDLLCGRHVNAVTCYSVPDSKPRELAFTRIANGIRIQVPTLEIWNVIKVVCD